MVLMKLYLSKQMSIMMYQAKIIDETSEEDTKGSERKVPKNEAFCFQDWPTQRRIFRTLEMLCARKLQESIKRLPTPPLKKKLMRRSLKLVSNLSIETR